MKTFAEFIVDKTSNFNSKFDEFCENLVVLDVEFDLFWDHYALPYLITGEYSSVEELNEGLGSFIKNFGGSKLNPMNMAGGNQGSHWFNPKPDAFRSGMDKWQKDQKNTEIGNNIQNWADEQSARAAKEAELKAARDKMLGSAQSGADQHVARMKQKFAQAMQGFLKSSSDDALHTGDKMAYQIANKFYHKIMSVAQPVIDGYAPKVGIGKSQHNADFDQRKAGMMGTMKQGLANKFAQAPAAQPDQQAAVA